MEIVDAVQVLPEQKKNDLAVTEKDQAVILEAMKPTKVGKEIAVTHLTGICTCNDGAITLETDEEKHNAISMYARTSVAKGFGFTMFAGIKINRDLEVAVDASVVRCKVSKRKFGENLAQYAERQRPAVYDYLNIMNMLIHDKNFIVDGIKVLNTF